MSLLESGSYFAEDHTLSLWYDDFDRGIYSQKTEFLKLQIRDLF